MINFFIVWALVDGSEFQKTFEKKKIKVKKNIYIYKLERADVLYFHLWLRNSNGFCSV